ncbi:uncharacterized protein RAG0_08865 [Rhynchosporium agropyri]|uniref:Uncharacterized protein n=1 Tax=Rhynchosporium agropyri TaxID=914238 RepID=A0A1E1KSR8_9HELO|nr:uncharacterized protein RAG0_08865 [Rhynchosporium agropyri]
MSPNPAFRSRNEKDPANTISGSDLRSGSLALNSGSFRPTGSSSSRERTYTPETLASSERPIALLEADTEADTEQAVEGGDGIRYSTFTATQTSGPYVTLIASSDANLPTARYPAPQKTLYGRNSRVPNPRLPTGTVVGIVIGFVVGAMLLAGVAYVYLLRLRHLKRMRRRRRRAKRAKTGSSGSAPAPAPAPSPPPDGALPPANP